MPAQAVLHLGNYRLIERIGEGGMAEVFRAERLSTPLTQGSGPPSGGDQPATVVIKRIRPELSSQPEFPIFRAMFLNEANLVRRLSHPNLARVFALHEAADPVTGVSVPFIVGEFVKGRELWTVMRTATRGFAGGGIPYGIAAYVIREVARGLGHAHAHRSAESGRAAPIIHRDVSPENIMISDEGQVKVIDFGVAKALGGFGPQTRTGIIKGKLSYMSPEQVAQRAVPATDVFGAGIVLHELLTGRRLFGGQNDFLVVQRVLKAVIPPPSTRVQLPRELDEVVMRALERGLGRRYPDGNALADALTDVMERSPEMRGIDAAALMGWVQQVEQQGTRAPGRREPEQESDLHVDVDKTIKAVEEARTQTIDLAAEDLLFDAVEGPVDPSIHAAVTQAMRTLDIKVLSRPPRAPPAPPGGDAPALPLPGTDVPAGAAPPPRAGPVASSSPGLRPPGGDPRTSSPGLRAQEGDPRTSSPGLRAQEGDPRTSSPGLRAQEGDSRTSSPGLRAQEGDPRISGPGLRPPEGDPRISGPGLRAPEGDPRASGPGLRAPVNDPRISGPGLRAPVNDPRISGPGLRAPEGDPRTSSPGRPAAPVPVMPAAAPALSVPVEARDQTRRSPMAREITTPLSDWHHVPLWALVTMCLLVVIVVMLLVLLALK